MEGRYATTDNIPDQFPPTLCVAASSSPTMLRPLVFHHPSPAPPPTLSTTSSFPTLHTRAGFHSRPFDSRHSSLLSGLHVSPDEELDMVCLGGGHISCGAGAGGSGSGGRPSGGTSVAALRCDSCLNPALIFRSGADEVAGWVAGTPAFHSSSPNVSFGPVPASLSLIRDGGPTRAVGVAHWKAGRKFLQSTAGPRLPGSGQPVVPASSDSAHWVRCAG